MDYEIYQGDAKTVLRTVIDRSVRCCVTSPPYWGLRDYGVDGQLGLESNPDEYVAKMVEVFREVRRVLKDDGTLWLNLGDCYNGGGKGGHAPNNTGNKHGHTRSINFDGALKPKDLVGIPWRVAFALQADGWYLRSDIIWHKPNPIPESVFDRPTKAHEYIFLFSKSRRYYYGREGAIEPCVSSENDRKRMREGRPRNGGKWAVVTDERLRHKHLGVKNKVGNGETRNRRTVWTVTTKPFKGAHFATFPPDLIEPCILAGSEPGDLVIDPFSGSGTTGIVALNHGRKFLGIELNPQYCSIARLRIAEECRPLNSTTAKI